MTRRAEAQAETRRRIAEAALELHASVGPARTTFSMVAERAGVQRHTLYAHFPDEKSLFLACSGLHQENDPPPDGADWREIADRGERLRAGFGAIYAWFERNAELMGHVVRDAEVNEALREVSRMRMAARVGAWRAALGDPGDDPARAAMLGLALSFHAWRSLARDGGLGSAGAAELITGAVLAAGAGAGERRSGEPDGRRVSRRSAPASPPR